MSYKRFDLEDIVVSSDAVTAPCWANNAVSLSAAYTSSTQVAASSGNYYYNIYNEDPNTSSTASIQFSIAYGNRSGSNAQAYDAAVSESYSSTVYGQFRTLLLGDEDTDFTFASSSGAETVTPDSVAFISVERARFKEKLFPGSLTLRLRSGSNYLTLTDNSVDITTDTFVDSGRVYSLYSGSSGVVNNSEVEWGKIYPDVGIIALNHEWLNVSGGYIDLSGSGAHNYTTHNNNDAIFRSIDSGSRSEAFALRSEETVTSNYVFIRCRNAEFNYSNNPSNITGSGELRHSVMIDSPQSYITAVGLYNDNNDLLAVAKLSTPLLKDFTKEALIRVKLDY